MSELILIRHAETDMAGTFCGHSDPDLNDRGYAQAYELIKRLRAEQVAAVYTSDLHRAVSTAEIIASSFAVVCCVRPALREIGFGEWEGLIWQEIEQRDKGYAQRWLDEYPLLSAPGGEDFHDFEERALNEVKSLATTAADGVIVVVTHAGVLRTVLRRLCGYSETDAHEHTRAYCSVVRYMGETSSAAQVAEVCA